MLTSSSWLECVARGLGGDHPPEQAVPVDRAVAEALRLHGQILPQLEDRLLRGQERVELGPVPALEPE